MVSIAAERGLPQKEVTTYLRVMDFDLTDEMDFDLTDEETAALLRELDHIIDGDRFLPSPRLRTLKAIRDKLRPPPAREPLPPPKTYAPPRAKGRRRGESVCS